MAIPLAAAFALFTTSCEKTEPVTTDNAKPVFTQVMDIDNDGIMELVIGFKRTDIESLEDENVTLYGRLFTTNTAFETDPFNLTP
jgi:hypothetical protein